jgi:hypothetical protein
MMVVAEKSSSRSGEEAHGRRGSPWRAPHVLLPGRLSIGPCHGDTVGEAVGGADSLPRPPSRLSAMASVAPDFSPLRFCEIIPA